MWRIEDDDGGMAGLMFAAWNGILLCGISVANKQAL